MHRVSQLLTLIGALCFLVAGISIGLTLATPIGASAAPLISIGTPTPPPQPTEEPTEAPTQVPPMATAEQPSPANTPRPTRPPDRHTDPTPEPSPTAAPPTATPEPWTTDVELTKQANKTTVLSGDTFAYTLLARNIGTKAAFDVVVTDQVPEQLEVVNLASTKGDIALEGQTVTAYPRTLEAGEVAEYQITVRVRENAGPGEISNTGHIATSTSGDTPGNNTSTVTVEIRTPERKIQTVPSPPRLPRTAENEPVTVLAALATISPITWAGLFGGLLFMFGGVLSWGVRGWLRREPAKVGSSSVWAAPQGIVSAAYRVPPTAPLGPPRLGPELPAAAPPAPLPPLVQLNRDDALRDAVRGDGEE